MRPSWRKPRQPTSSATTRRWRRPSSAMRRVAMPSRNCHATRRRSSGACIAHFTNSNADKRGGAATTSRSRGSSRSRSPPTTANTGVHRGRQDGMVILPNAPNLRRSACLSWSRRATSGTPEHAACVSSGTVRAEPEPAVPRSPFTRAVHLDRSERCSTVPRSSANSGSKSRRTSSRWPSSACSAAALDGCRRPQQECKSLCRETPNPWCGPVETAGFCPTVLV